MKGVSKKVLFLCYNVVITIILAFIVLKETVNVKTIIGGIFITIGTFVMIL